MADPPAWNSRLQVSVDGTVISPIDTFNPTFNLPVTVLHSLEGDNVAHIVGPQTFTFTMAVKGIGPAVAKLTDMARKRQAFTVSVSEAKGTDWSFNNIAFNNCFITTIANVITIEGVPTTTFTCMCLDVADKPA
jgi:hypothetical protein